MAAYTDDQWDAVLERARTSGVWTLDDSRVLRQILDSNHAFGLHLLHEVEDARTVLVEALVAAPCGTPADVNQLIHFKGQVFGVDKILALLRELAERDVGNA